MVRAGPLCQGFAGSALVGREQIAGEQTGGSFLCAESWGVLGGMLLAGGSDFYSE